MTVSTSTIPMIEPTQIGDTVRDIIPLGMKYADNFTTADGATAVLETLADGSEVVKVGLPVAPVAEAIEFSFDVIPNNEGCGEATIIAEFVRSVSGLMCGTTACDNSSVILQEAESPVFVMDKPELNILSVTAPAPCVEGDLVTLKIQPLTDADVEQCLCSATEYTINEPLPIDLVKFDVNQNGCDIDVKWSTGKEESFSHFIVERSDDNGRTYNAISSEIYGKGDNSEYAYTDQVTFSNTLLYRLSVVDKNEKVTYSMIKSITTKPCSQSNITMVPNPTDGYVKVDGLSKGQTVYIFNTLGQMVHTQTVPADQTSIEMDLSNIAPAAYYIKVLDMNRVSLFNEKLIKK